MALSKILIPCLLCLWLIPISAPAAEDEPQAEIDWPYVEPLFALSAQPSSHLRLRSGFSNNPEVDSLAFALEGGWASGDFGLQLRIPLGLAMLDNGDNEFTFGDAQLGLRYRAHHEEEDHRQLTFGLNLTAPSSRIGEKADQAGQPQDTSNFGKRHEVAQTPFLDLGLVPRLNFAITPFVALAQNVGRVSLQADLGCMILVMDNLDETVYGPDERLGFLLFFDLAAPVSLTDYLAIVIEFNALVALDKLGGAGFFITIGPRYTRGGLSLGLGAQLPLGVDHKGDEDDKVAGRYDQVLLARHHFSGLLDLAYHF